MESYNPGDGTHLVSYTDGTEEWIVLATEKVHLHLHPGEVPPPPSAPGVPPAGPSGGDVAMEDGGGQPGPGDDVAPAGAEAPAGEGGDDGRDLPDGLDAVGWRISVFFPGERVW